MQTPLVGRQPETARFRAALQDPDTTGLLLTGAPGTGKTRLAAEWAGQAGTRGYTTAWVAACDAAAAIPLGAFVHLLPASGVGVDRFEVLHAAVHHFAEQARGGRYLLIVDDAHLLDEVSVALVHQVATATEAFVVATLRSGQPLAASPRGPVDRGPRRPPRGRGPVA